MKLDTITPEEFEKRLDAANTCRRQEITDTEERLRQLETLLAQKEAFVLKLEQMLADVERDEAQIAAAEQQLRLRRLATRRRAPVSTLPQ